MRLCLTALLLLAACAGAPAYGPAGESSLGYREQIIESGRYRVSYRGRSVETAENGALRRAAELSLQNGYDWFTVVNRSLDRERPSGGSSVGIGGGTGGARSGVGLGVNIPISGGRGTVTSRLEVVMGRGQRPEGPRTYDADATAANLAAL